MKQIASVIRDFLVDRFNLNEDRADEDLIIETIRREVQFRGTNLWTLIFAIFIASIGLNVNSTAVIIGAMLISPLMGPIMGIGLSIGISDFELLKKGIKNLCVAAIISIATSFLYFTISPLDDASSELLARTNPSIWDVFIAFFGGLAGIVAGTRKRKSNVIPGVAIATALMPPLCTAGYGLASGQWVYFLGAGYLFFINSLFICLATFLIVKHLRFRKATFSSPEMERKVSGYFFFIAVLTILPSIYFAYRIVQKSIFESNARRFVKREFHLPHSEVISERYGFNGTNSYIEVFLFGESLPAKKLDSIKSRLASYNLGNTNLTVHQGASAQQKLDLSLIQESLLKTIYTRGSDSGLAEVGSAAKVPDLTGELRALYPNLRYFSLSKTILNYTSTGSKDTISLFVGNFAPPLPAKEKARLAGWLQKRIPADTVKIVLE